MSDLLNQASLVYIPSGYKEDTAYSVIPTDGSADLQFTRASDGTRVNSSGLVENVPWNLLQQSNTFNTTWVLSNATVTSGQSGYDGSNNAWEFDASGIAQVSQSVSTSGIQTFSVYAKAGSENGLFLRANGGNNPRCFFNLDSGTIGNEAGGLIDSEMLNVGNGWYRCTIIYSDTTNEARIYVANNSGGFPTSGSIYIQDAQLNQGSTAKPYFPTTDRQNVPRLTYEGGCPSLLLEPQRTNLYPYSEDLTQWTTSGSPTITGNDAISPDGTTNADRVQFSADTDMLYNSGTGSAGTNVVSVWAKAKSGTAQKFRFFVNGATLYSSDLTATDQWQRFDFVYTYSAQTVGLRGATTGASDVLFWGFQHEVGSYPTSYIGPTTSAAVTRVADAAYKTSATALIGQTEGTMFVEINAIDVTDSRVTISDGTSSNRLILRIHGNGKIQWEGIQSGAGQWNIESSSGTIVSGSTYKIAAAYGTNDVALYVNGTQIGVDNSAVVTSALSIFRFANAAGGTLYHWNQYTKQAALFKTRLTNAELAALTTL